MIVSLANLSQDDRNVVRQCLRAAVEGPFFPDWEFDGLFGLDRAEVRKILGAWPDLDESSDSVHLAINNSLGNLLGYPHGCESQWSQFISVSAGEVSRVFNLLRDDV